MIKKIIMVDPLIHARLAAMAAESGRTTADIIRDALYQCIHANIYTKEYPEHAPTCPPLLRGTRTRRADDGKLIQVDDFGLALGAP